MAIYRDRIIRFIVHAYTISITNCLSRIMVKVQSSNHIQPSQITIIFLAPPMIWLICVRLPNVMSLCFVQLSQSQKHNCYKYNNVACRPTTFSIQTCESSVIYMVVAVGRFIKRSQLQDLKNDSTVHFIYEICTSCLIFFGVSVTNLPCKYE